MKGLQLSQGGLSQRGRKRIVIVDDSRTMQAFLEQRLSNLAGFEIVGVASDGRSGLEMVRRLHPDLVTIDLQMPYIDGRQLLQAIQDLDDICKVVVSNSACDNLGIKACLEELGADACVGKRQMSRDPDDFCKMLMTLQPAGTRRVARPAGTPDRGTAPPRPRAVDAALSPSRYPVPIDEAGRLAALDMLDLANDDPDHQLDLLTAHLVETTRYSACAITFIDRTTQWTKAAYGIARGQMPRAEALCSHAICGADPLIVDDVRSDVRFRTLTLVTAGSGIRSYVGHPIVTSAGVRLGTICLMDTQPRRVTTAELTSLRSVGRIAAEWIEHRGSTRKRAA